jgi:inorganic pyrophosphatase
MFLSGMAETHSCCDGLADPNRLQPVSPDSDLLQVVIETPRGSRNKYHYDLERRVFVLKKTLPAGMSFPYDFGFLPSTLAPDGDPIDVMVLMEEPAFPGCIAPARLIGVIEGEQDEDGRTMRNDRLLAVSETNYVYAELKSIDDLPQKLVDQMGEFFVNYSRLEGREYRLLRNRGVAEARRLIEESRAAARR